MGPGNWNLRVCIGGGKVNRRKSWVDRRVSFNEELLDF